MRKFLRELHSVASCVTNRDSNVGVARELSLEPQITSTYGYIDTSKSLDELSAANLFTASELLNPMGVMHDDPDRTAIECLFDVATKPC